MPRFVISDHHFGHANIIDYAARPFLNVEEMDAALVARWNSVVMPEDEVFHLGDFAFGKPEQIKAYRQKLSGIIHLVKGNHDRMSEKKYLECGFATVSSLLEVNVAGNKVRLRHKPDPKPFFHTLCGHVHQLDVTYPNVNLCVERWDYTPQLLNVRLFDQ